MRKSDTLFTKKKARKTIIMTYLPRSKSIQTKRIEKVTETGKSDTLDITMT